MKLYEPATVVKVVLLLIAFLSSVAPATGATIPSTPGWFAIPNTHVRSACPSNNFGASGYAFQDNCPGLMNAWNGGVFDTTRNRFIIWGGGHTDYSGNEMYSLDLNTLVLNRLTDPAVPVASGCAETLEGGQPNSRHTYDGIEYLPNVDKMFVFGGALATCGNASSSTWLFDFGNNQWEAKKPSGPIPRADYGIVTAYDSNTGKLFLHDSLNLFAYSPVANAYQQLTNNDSSIDYHMTAMIDPKRRKFVILGGGQAWVYDISGRRFTRKALSTSGGAAIINADYPGLAYSPALDRIVAWNGGNTIYELNLDTNSWTSVSYPGGPARGVTGVFGHWQYVPALDVFVTVNNVDADIFSVRIGISTPTAASATGNTSAPSAAVSATTLTGTAAPASLTGTPSFQLTSGISGTVPFTVGLGFKKGDVAGFPVLDASTAQVIVKSRWSDNSVKHAIASGRIALTAGVPATVNVSSSASAPGGTNLTASDIQAANPSASVQLGSFGTVNLSNLLANPFRTWISGPEMVEAHYRSSVGSDPTLQVWFYVRLYKNGQMWIRTVVENGFLDVTPSDKTYVPNVTIGGATVFNNGGASLTHYGHTRWTAEGWIGGDPQITPKHDTTYLMASKLVPNYWKRNPSSTALNGLHQTYSPMQGGDWTPNMGDTGYQPQIGLLPLWDALYITSGADARAYQSVLANAKALSSYPIVWDDSATRLPSTPSGRPTWTIDGPNAGGETQYGAGTLSWDLAHHGSGGYLAYLITGDYFYLETMEDQSSLCYLFNSSGQGSGTSRIMQQQTRGVAWCNRTVGQLTGIGPSDAVVNDYRTLLANNAAYWNSLAQKPGENPLGYVYSYEIGSYGTGAVSAWQQHFWAQTYGFVSDLEPFSDMSTWNAVRDHLYESPVGILGPTGTSNYCFTGASAYTIVVSSNNSSDSSTWYPSWGTVYQNTFGTANTSCGNTLTGSSGGDPANASTGYWGNLLPAIAYAVEDGAPGASNAWTRLTGASNWSTVANSGFDDRPIWGIVPRTTTASSSTPSFDFSLTNRSNKTATAGQSVTNSVSVISSTAPSVSFSVSGLPTGTTTGILQVGSTRRYTTIGAALTAAVDGNTIEIDAGTYNETLTIAKNNLTIKGVGGYARLNWGTGNYLTNTATIPNGKGLMVIDGSGITIDGLEFSGAKVNDQNGAGIRYEGGDLTIRHSYFHDNENGIMGEGGPSNTLLIENSIFQRNGYCPSSCAHNVYIGFMGRLIFRFNKSMDSHEGHTLKSRASVNEVISNFLSTKNSDGSYEADFPSGGTVYFIGNVIEQGANTGNSSILAYGEEGITNSTRVLDVVNNTFYNFLGSGTFLDVKGSPTLIVKNNLFAGGGAIGPVVDSTNKTVTKVGRLTDVHPGP